jgi:hypothetical protein
VIYDSGNKKFAGRDGNTTHPSGRVVQRMVDQGESRGLKVMDLAIVYAHEHMGWRHTLRHYDLVNLKWS